MKNTKISIKEAAALMGVSEQYIRIGLQRGILPIGCAMKMTGNRYTYECNGGGETNE